MRELAFASQTQNSALRSFALQNRSYVEENPEELSLFAEFRPKIPNIQEYLRESGVQCGGDSGWYRAQKPSDITNLFRVIAGNNEIPDGDFQELTQIIEYFGKK